MSDLLWFILAVVVAVAFAGGVSVWAVGSAYRKGLYTGLRRGLEGGYAAGVLGLSLEEARRELEEALNGR